VINFKINGSFYRKINFADIRFKRIFQHRNLPIKDRDVHLDATMILLHIEHQKARGKPEEDFGKNCIISWFNYSNIIRPKLVLNK